MKNFCDKKVILEKGTLTSSNDNKACFRNTVSWLFIMNYIILHSNVNITFNR